jgi:hypothetical protein
MFNFVSFLAFATAALAVNVQVKYDQTTYSPIYDNSAQSTSTVDCAGTITQKNSGWTNFGDLPNFPYIGGADVVTEFDGPGCGTCWKLSYQGKSVNVGRRS